MILKTPIFILNYAIHFLLWLLMALLGWILVPIMTKLKRYHTVTSRFDSSRQIVVFKDWFMYPWSSDEDGIDGHANKETYDPDFFKRVINWSCKRNAVGNHRFIWPFQLILEPCEIKFIASKGYTKGDVKNIDANFWYIAWQGYRASFRIHYKRLRIWVGWKIYPMDQKEVCDCVADIEDPRDHIEVYWRRYGVGIAKQFKMMRHYT
jgi:hypothetical protein